MRADSRDPHAGPLCESISPACYAANIIRYLEIFSQFNCFRLNYRIDTLICLEDGAKAIQRLSNK